MKSIKNFKTNLVFGVLLLAPTLVSPGPSRAACDRDDVDHYLAKGFSPEQITTLCGDNKNAVTPEPSHASGEEVAIPNFDKHRKLLIESIAGYDISLDENRLAYTKRECVENDDEDQYGFSTKTCFEVRYGIERNGLEVKGLSKKYLFLGDTVLTLKGKVDRDVKLDLTKYRAVVKDRIRMTVGMGDKLSIPIHDGLPEGRVLQAFKEIIKE